MLFLTDAAAVVTGASPVVAGAGYFIILVRIVTGDNDPLASAQLKL